MEYKTYTSPQRWIKKSIISYLKEEFRLEWGGIHGKPHWNRVYKNAFSLGKKIEKNGSLVDYDVLYLFSMLHDHQREDDDVDFQHGERAALKLKELKGVYFELPNVAYEELKRACQFHSNGKTKDESINVMICWDADRLDLPRIGITPIKSRLCTEEAKKDYFIQAAKNRIKPLK